MVSLVLEPINNQLTARKPIQMVTSGKNSILWLHWALIFGQWDSNLQLVGHHARMGNMEKASNMNKKNCEEIMSYTKHTKFIFVCKLFQMNFRRLSAEVELMQMSVAVGHVVAKCGTNHQYPEQISEAVAFQYDCFKSYPPEMKFTLTWLPVLVEWMI